LLISYFHSWCTFQLSDDWFAPAEASLKRSVIRKLIHKIVTEPSHNFPELTCAADQCDERHQRSENAEQEAAIEFLAQGFSAGESDSVCQIPGAQQESTSICFNSPGKGPPVSGFGLETADGTMFAVQNMQVQF
jgi:sentrin-specific protease 7